MGTEVANIYVRIGAEISDLTKGFQKAVKEVGKMGDSFKTIGEEMSKYITAPVVGIGALAAKELYEAQGSISLLQGTLRNVGESYDQAGGKIEGFLTSLEDTTTFSDDKLRNTFSSIVQLTGSMASGFELTGLAADVARARNIDLESAATLVGRVAQGNTEILRRYGIQLRDGATATEALGVLQQKFGGSAASYGNSFAGSLDRIRNATGNLFEEIGTALLPVFNSLTTKILWAVNIVRGLVAQFDGWSVAAKAAAAGVVGLVAAIGPALIVTGTLLTSLKSIQVALAAVNWSMVAVAAKIALLAAVALVLVANWEKIKAGAQLYFYGALEIIGYFAEEYFRIWAKMTSKVPGISKAFRDMASEISVSTASWSQKAVEAEKKWNTSGDMWANTVTFVKTKFEQMAKSIDISTDSVDKFHSKMSQGALYASQASASYAMAAQAGATAAAAGSAALNAQLLAQQTAMTTHQSFMAQAAQNMSDSVTSSMTMMGGNMALSMAQGTGQAGQLLNSFLQSTLSSMASWAIANMGIMKALSAAIRAALMNPFVAVAAIAGLIAVVHGLKGSFQKTAVPALGDGGITTGPTLAMIGEKGPEAVIPLNKSGALGGGSSTIIIEMDSQAIAKKTVPHMPGILRMKGVLA